jgi:hypothetical protein
MPRRILGAKDACRCQGTNQSRRVGRRSTSGGRSSESSLRPRLRLRSQSHSRLGLGVVTTDNGGGGMRSGKRSDCRLSAEPTAWSGAATAWLGLYITTSRCRCMGSCREWVRMLIRPSRAARCERACSSLNESNCLTGITLVTPAKVIPVGPSDEWRGYGVCVAAWCIVHVHAVHLVIAA